MFVLWQRFKYLCLIWSMLNMENYRQLPAKMHLISMRLASCLLTTCLFSTDISPVCSSLSGFKFAYWSPAFLTYVVWQHIQRIQEISVLQNSRLFSTRSKPSHFPPKKRGLSHRLSVAFHNGLHREADVRRTVGQWRHNQNFSLSWVCQNLLSMGLRGRASGYKEAKGARSWGSKKPLEVW